MGWPGGMTVEGGGVFVSCEYTSAGVWCRVVFHFLNLFQDGELFSASRFIDLRHAAIGNFFQYQH